MAPSESKGSSTVPERVSVDRLRDGRLRRRVGLAALVLFLTIGALGWMGPRTEVATASDDGYTLTVTYPAVTRPGLPIRWEFAVTHAGGFDGPVALATTFDVLHLFDISNLEPDAAHATAGADDMTYVFAPPEGDTLRVSMDGSVEVGLHELPTATTRVIVGGETVVSLDYRVVVVP